LYRSHYGVCDSMGSAVEAISILYWYIVFYYFYELVNKLKGCILPPVLCCLNSYKAKVGS
jgi:hypothetical protein